MTFNRNILESKTFKNLRVECKGYKITCGTKSKEQLIDALMQYSDIMLDTNTNVDALTKYKYELSLSSKAELKEMCKVKGARVSGNKKALTIRLVALFVVPVAVEEEDLDIEMKEPEIEDLDIEMEDLSIEAVVEIEDLDIEMTDLSIVVEDYSERKEGESDENLVIKSDVAFVEDVIVPFVEDVIVPFVKDSDDEMVNSSDDETKDVLCIEYISSVEDSDSDESFNPLEDESVVRDLAPVFDESVSFAEDSDEEMFDSSNEDNLYQGFIFGFGGAQVTEIKEPVVIKEPLATMDVVIEEPLVVEAVETTVDEPKSGWIKFMEWAAAQDEVVVEEPLVEAVTIEEQVIRWETEEVETIYNAMMALAKVIKSEEEPVVEAKKVHEDFRRPLVEGKFEEWVAAQNKESVVVKEKTIVKEEALVVEEEKSAWLKVVTLDTLVEKPCEDEFVENMFYVSDTEEQVEEKEITLEKETPKGYREDWYYYGDIKDSEIERYEEYTRETEDLLQEEIDELDLKDLSPCPSSTDM